MFVQPTSKKSPSPPPPQANIKPHGGLQPQEQSNNRFSQAQVCYDVCGMLCCFVSAKVASKLIN